MTIFGAFAAIALVLSGAIGEVYGQATPPRPTFAAAPIKVDSDPDAAGILLPTPGTLISNLPASQ